MVNEDYRELPSAGDDFSLIYDCVMNIEIKFSDDKLIDSKKVELLEIARIMAQHLVDKHAVGMFQCHTLAIGKLREFFFFTNQENKVFDEFKSMLNSINGKKGAKSRNQSRESLVEYALNLASNFPDTDSANFIAYEIQNDVLAKGIEVGFPLTPQNAQDTIQKWINADRKKS